MMLDFIGWQKAAEKIRKAVQKTICDRVVTYDLARQLEGARKVKCSEFATALIERL
jgi:isocitrate dehydrogenase